MTEIIDPTRKILRFPRRLTPVKEGQQGSVINVEWDLSNCCNLKCAHCDFAHVHDGYLTSQNEADRILDQIVEAGALSVTITGGGEPTLNPEFSRVARQAHGLGLAVGVYTNGTNLDALCQSAPALTWVYVSLDAVSPQDYVERKLRGARSGRAMFFDVLNTVRVLTANRHHRANPTVGLGFLVDGKWTPADLKDATVIAHDFGADYCQFRPIVGLTDYTWVDGLLSTLDALVSPSVLVSRRRFTELQDWGRSYHLCLASEFVACVGADGTLWVCPNTRNLRPLGNLIDEDWATLWGRRRRQTVGADCRVACRGHELNETLHYVCGQSPHDTFV